MPIPERTAQRNGSMDTLLRAPTRKACEFRNIKKISQDPNQPRPRDVLRNVHRQERVPTLQFPISELHAETIGPTRVCSKRVTFKLEIEVEARTLGCKLIHALLGNSGV